MCLSVNDIERYHAGSLATIEFTGSKYAGAFDRSIGCDNLPCVNIPLVLQWMIYLLACRRDAAVQLPKERITEHE